MNEKKKNLKEDSVTPNRTIFISSLGKINISTYKRLPLSGVSVCCLSLFLKKVEKRILSHTEIITVDKNEDFVVAKEFSRCW